MERKLASIQKIVNLEPIVGADKIELAQVLGWKCIVKKDEFKVGEYCIYVEIDSKVPEIPAFEFLAKRNYKVKTLKMRGAISQGLVLPLNKDMFPFLSQYYVDDEDDDACMHFNIFMRIKLLFLLLYY